MKDEKKKKIINISLIVGLIVLIVFVIITSIVIYNQNQRYNDLKQDNDHISDILDDQENGKDQSEGDAEQINQFYL